MGRPKQPYCLDCLKEGKKVLKEAGKGYCGPCRALRQAAYNQAGQKVVEPEATPEDQRVTYLKRRVSKLEVGLATSEGLVETLSAANVRMLESGPEYGALKEDVSEARREMFRLMKFCANMQRRLHELVPDEYPDPMIERVWERT